MMYMALASMRRNEFSPFVSNRIIERRLLNNSLIGNGTHGGPSKPTAASSSVEPIRLCVRRFLAERFVAVAAPLT